MLLNHECPICNNIHELECTPEPNAICFECENEFVIAWLDSYNTHNHSDQPSAWCINKEGLKNIKENYPVTEIDNWDMEGWVDCSHSVKFTAYNWKEFKEKVQNILDENGRIVDVFSVMTKNNKTIYTEEDL